MIKINVVTPSTEKYDVYVNGKRIKPFAYKTLNFESEYNIEVTRVVDAIKWYWIINVLRKSIGVFVGAIFHMDYPKISKEDAMIKSTLYTYKISKLKLNDNEEYEIRIKDKSNTTLNGNNIDVFYSAEVVDKAVKRYLHEWVWFVICWVIIIGLFITSIVVISILNGN